MLSSLCRALHMQATRPSARYVGCAPRPWDTSPRFSPSPPCNGLPSSNTPPTSPSPPASATAVSSANATAMPPFPWRGGGTSSPRRGGRPPVVGAAIPEARGPRTTGRQRRRVAGEEELDGVEVRSPTPGEEYVFIVRKSLPRRGDQLPDRQFQRRRSIEVFLVGGAVVVRRRRRNPFELLEHVLQIVQRLFDVGRNGRVALLPVAPSQNGGGREFPAHQLRFEDGVAPLVVAFASRNRLYPSSSPMSNRC
mmetsp:Transcript_36324/g.77468  ORF Transcript_36324/g.77468 Transcript_36324/m.77468 type:complete len:251 (-) Transcript_36324:1043-1795(-)